MTPLMTTVEQELNRYDARARRLEAALSRIDPRLTPTLARFLLYLSGQGPLTPNQIAKRLKLSPGTVYPLVNKVRLAGWLEEDSSGPVKSGRPARARIALNTTGRSVVARLREKIPAPK